MSDLKNLKCLLPNTETLLLKMIDHSDNKGDKILFRFAKGSYNQKAEIINVLVEFGADLTEKDKEGKRAFDYMTPNDRSSRY